jgi:demethylmenaquinone methyltransferase/2-methoxy-6-polyprenyl-1,4-benzoquinol methylase
MFDDISPKYDFLNHLLSFGFDIHWRNRLSKYLPEKSGLKVLDLATGTADILLSLFKRNPDVLTGCGIDMAEKMMELGRKKIVAQGLDDKITLKHGDAHQIPYEEESFDTATIAFGIRNMDNPKQVLREMYRVITPGGRGLVLEFSLPHNSLLRAIHIFYLRHFVPLIGAAFSGHYQAYKYLNQTIETFPYGEDFCVLLKKAGFIKVTSHPLLFGVATIYQGDKL